MTKTTTKKTTSSTASRSSSSTRTDDAAAARNCSALGEAFATAEGRDGSSMRRPPGNHRAATSAAPRARSRVASARCAPSASRALVAVAGLLAVFAVSPAPASSRPSRWPARLDRRASAQPARTPAPAPQATGRRCRRCSRALLHGRHQRNDVYAADYAAYVAAKASVGKLTGTRRKNWAPCSPTSRRSPRPAQLIALAPARVVSDARTQPPVVDDRTAARPATST